MIMFPADLSEDALPPCLPELSRVMAAGVETGDPPPGAEQCIRWTLSILHIPASLDDKGQACA